MIPRNIEELLKNAAKVWPSITLTGPRQCGKTTTCKYLFPHLPYRNLEDLDTRDFAKNDPRGFLEQLPHGAILDEIQQAPDLPSYLMGIIDENREPGRWVLTGSQHFTLLKTISQSLAGRTGVYHMMPLTQKEMQQAPYPPKSLEETIIKGSFPEVYLSENNHTSWFRSYLNTYIERDIRSLSQVQDIELFRRFMSMCAGRTSQVWNATSLAGVCDISRSTVNAWLNILATGFMSYRLYPMVRNVRKRMTKAPKLHFYDSALVCALLGIETVEQFHKHPLRGEIFETWAVSEIIKERINHERYYNQFYYRDRTKNEVDLIVQSPMDEYTLFEMKSSKTANTRLWEGAFKVRDILEKAGLKTSVVVVYGGNRREDRKDVTLLPWNEIHTLPWKSV